jgi:membrane-bound metal-dependent hydrolase YbcI (DUF457 family)
MMARTHAATGILVGTAVVFFTHITDPIPVFIGVASGSLVPDIDEPHSRISNTLFPLSNAVSIVTQKISGGHRHLTHSLAGIALMILGLWAFGKSGLEIHNTHISINAIEIELFFATFIVFKAVIPKLLRFIIGGWLTALLLSGVTATVLGNSISPEALAFSFGLGASVHILGDSFTHGGVPLLYPISARTFGYKAIQTNGLVETVITASLWIIIVVLVMHLRMPSTIANFYTTEVHKVSTFISYLKPRKQL